MAHYMIQFAYTPEAWASMLKNPEDRGAAFGALAQKMGGQFTAIYYGFGEYDGFVLFDAPDEQAALATVIAAVGPGHPKATKTTVLFTMDEVLAALRKAGAATYKAPTG